MRLVAVAALLALVVHADVYMHNPRGSNNRNCRTDNGEDRRTNNRLFDSQNNPKGGYSCPLARPYPCYKFQWELNQPLNPADNVNEVASQAATDACNEQGFATRDSPGVVNAYGSTDPAATVTPRMYYYSGSQLTIEWTNQHGCGANPKLHCDIVLQYACEDTLTDEWGGVPAIPRDGVPVTNKLNGYANDDERNLNAEATKRIPRTNEAGAQTDFRYGRHETLTYYNKCRNRERNKGLFIADQNVRNDRGATATRQNANGDDENTRNGLECPEESEYWPYWHDSPWKDIAVLTNRPDDCAEKVRWSQNTQEKWECICVAPACTVVQDDENDLGNVPNHEAACREVGGVWTRFPPHNLPAPHCGEAPMARENHLGHPAAANMHDTPFMGSSYNWTVPHVAFGEHCVLRLRYNISTGDYDSVTLYGTSANSPLKDRNNNEVASYKNFKGCATKDELVCEFGLNNVYQGARLGIAMNTNQYGRTFQDRSYMFSIRSPPGTGECGGGKKIYNLNVRGKRGNIVDTYPAVEYDFVPSHLVVTNVDCIHVQWTGSDYNPNRNPNNGEGGPSSPIYNERRQSKSDRNNLVQIMHPSVHEPVSSFEEMEMFEISRERFENLMYIGQDFGNVEACNGIEKIKTEFQQEFNRDDRERFHKNCGKLSGALTPYFDAGLVRPGRPGEYAYMSTRNNNFSNRDQRGILVVRRGLSTTQLAFTIIGAFALAMGGLLFFAHRRRKNAEKFQSAGVVKSDRNSGTDAIEDRKVGGGSSRLVGGAAAAAGGAAVVAKAASKKAEPLKAEKATALYAHVANEKGELSFKKGESIEVLTKDSSGWWEGRTADGKRGLFPYNYVSLD